MLNNIDSYKLLPVILAGGSGERLWPLSRTAFPKQFLTLLGAKHSLLQNTIQRLPINSKILPPLIICHEDYRFIVAEQLRAINYKHSGIILEPQAKNTAPAIALAALWAQQHHPDSILLVLPADHLINDAGMLMRSVEGAIPAAQNGALVTFGVKITKPETGYGYIQVGAHNKVSKFIEKPDLALAQKMAADPGYLWNSGMFCFTPKAYLQELSVLQPDIIACSEYAVNECKFDLDFIRPNLKMYAQCPALSIDYAIMEHTDKAYVFALQGSWSDIGNWQAVWEHGAKDNDGNCIAGDIVTYNSSNCLIDARHRLIATMDVHDLAIIETSDAVLIANKDQCHNLKHLVSLLKQQVHPALQEHLQVLRPWGWYNVLAKGEGFQVKLICVQPGKSLSLQMHNHRSEHWIVVKGQAKIVRADEKLTLSANESTFIPLGIKHQLSNHSDTLLEVIEVQSGSYLGEDDIIRFADEHGRAVVDTVNV